MLSFEASYTLLCLKIARRFIIQAPDFIACSISSWYWTMNQFANPLSPMELLCPDMDMYRYAEYISFCQKTDVAMMLEQPLTCLKV